MNNRIVETIGKWGVKTSDYSSRMYTIKPGDVIRFGDNKEYPNHDADFGIVDSIDGNRITYCVHPMGIHLFENGNVSISGGPFGSCSKTDIEPTGLIQDVLMWNWADNSPGGGMGVNYSIARPVFQLKSKGTNS